jgi:RNA polymerase sigma-70 factor (ECF subfamily)
MTDGVDRLFEQVLVIRLQSGDERAFAELVDRYHARLHYYVRRLLPDADDADDVVQEIWLAAFRGIRALRDPRALRVWLYRVARNAALMKLRGERAVETLPVSVAAMSVEDKAEFDAAEAARIHAGLAKLRPEHREVLLLRFLERMSYEQIAEVVGCPLGTVRSRIHYAKRELRNQIGG